MGDTKRRRVWAAGAHDRLEAEFNDAGVDTSEFGFYDQPAFQARERSDPAYLEKYAQWVASRPLDGEYIGRAERVVPKLASLIAEALARDNMQGGCMVAFSLLTRMFDRLGIWSYGVIGSANLDVAELEMRRTLHTIDVKDHADAVLGHAWVCAPPYTVVDASLALQHWTGGPMETFVPPVVLAGEMARVVKPDVTDCVSDEVRAQFASMEGRKDPRLHHRLEPRLAAFGSKFPAIDVDLGRLNVRYVPIAIRQTEEPLEMVNGSGRIGRSGAEIWASVVAPAFKKMGEYPEGSVTPPRE